MCPEGEWTLGVQHTPLLGGHGEAHGAELWLRLQGRWGGTVVLSRPQIPEPLILNLRTWVEDRRQSSCLTAQDAAGTCAATSPCATSCLGLTVS